MEFIQPGTSILKSLDQKLKQQLDAKKTHSAKLAGWTPQIVIHYFKNIKKWLAGAEITHMYYFQITDCVFSFTSRRKKKEKKR